MKLAQYLCLAILICFALASSPANATGDCSDYTDLTGMDLPIEVTGTTAGAGDDYGPFAEEPTCWEGPWDAYCANGHDVTYKWTVPYDGRFTLTLFGSPSNADLLLYDFTCPAEPLYPDNFICGSHRCTMNCATVREIELTAGQEILIVVDGYLIWSGDFTLRIYDTTTYSDTVAMGLDLHQFAGFTGASAWGGAGRWRDALGLANVPDSIPVHDNHLFSMGSASQAVTGTAVMQLWEAGLFDLDDDVNGYLPFEIRNPDYPETSITFRMLLSNVSSIQDGSGGIINLLTEGEDSPISICELVEEWLTPGGTYYGPNSYHDYEPGTNWAFTRIGITLLACLVEHINPEGLSFEDYCQAHILEPLGMTSSSFLLANVDHADLAMRHYWDGEEFVPMPVITGPWYPADFLRSNGREMSRLLLAYMNGGALYGQRILEEATIDLMFTIQFPDANPTGGLIWRYREFEGEGIWALSAPAYADYFYLNFTALAVNPTLAVGAVGATNTTGGVAIDGYNAIWAMLGDLLRRGAEDAAIGVAVPDAGSAVPGLVQLGPCYPNPFNPQTSIRFEVSVAGHARLSIYDLRGRLITTLLDESVPAGGRTVTWDGRDAAGREIPSGTYLSRLEAGGHVAHGRMALVR